MEIVKLGGMRKRKRHNLLMVESVNRRFIQVAKQIRKSGGRCYISPYVAESEVKVMSQMYIFKDEKGIMMEHAGGKFKFKICVYSGKKGNRMIPINSVINPMDRPKASDSARLIMLALEPMSNQEFIETFYKEIS